MGPTREVSGFKAYSVTGIIHAGPLEINYRGVKGNSARRDLSICLLGRQRLLAAFAFGEQALPLAVVAFVVSTGMHFSLGIWIVSGRFHPGILLKNPVFIATLAGILAHMFDWHAPAIVLPGLKMMSKVAIPLMLVALGVRLIDFDLRHWRSGLLGALLCPASGLISALLALLWLQPDDQTRGVLLLFSLLPPAVMNFILAERYGRSSDEMASMVAMGNLASLMVIPIGLAFII